MTFSRDYRGFMVTSAVTAYRAVSRASIVHVSRDISAIRFRIHGQSSAPINALTTLPKERTLYQLNKQVT